MITTTISQTKNHLSELLASVRQGETLIITDRKKQLPGWGGAVIRSGEVLAEGALQRVAAAVAVETDILKSLLT